MDCYLSGILIFLHHMIKTKVLFIFLYLVISISSIILKITFYPNLSFNSPHDDLLFANLSSSIIKTGWLGPWTQNTLLKEPLFPIISAFFVYIDFPFSVQVFIHFIYLSISTTIFFFYRKVNQFILLLIYLFLAFNPYLFNYIGARHYREVLIALFVLGFFLSSTSIIFKLSPSLTFTVVSMVFFFSFFIVLKYDLVLWNLPLLIISLIFFTKHKLNNGGSISRILLITPILIFILITPLGIVSTLNFMNYKIFLITNQFQGDLPKLYGILSSIDSKRDNPKYVEVSLSQRELAYQVSPKFQQLRQYLEIPPNTGWKIQSCAALDICDESAGWFINDLRDAIYLNSDKTPHGYSNDTNVIYGEIKLACEKGTIECNNKTNYVELIVNYRFLYFLSSKLVHSLTFGILDTAINYSYESNYAKVNQQYSLQNFELFNYSVDFVDNKKINEFAPIYTKYFALSYLILFFTIIFINNVFKFKLQWKLHTSHLFFTMILSSPFILQIFMISILENLRGNYGSAYLGYMSESYSVFIVSVFLSSSIIQDIYLKKR
jgi:hypothetical protein